MFGVLNFDKPEGLTSRDVVNVVQRLVRPHKVGHAGTLDPMATGVLLVCIGKATRLIPMLQSSPKTYVAEFQLGQVSATDDSSGDVEVSNVELQGPPPTQEDVERELKSFQGTIDQVPPKFSAVKVNGHRAYKKAREGEDVELSAKKVTIHQIELLDYKWPRVVVSIECGSGTYIRSIARDLGEQLGCGGLMSGLQRTQIGEFSSSNGISLDDINAENVDQLMVNPLKVVSHIPHYPCSVVEREHLRNGGSFSARQNTADLEEMKGRTIALTTEDGEHLLAFAEIKLDGKVQPRQMFVRVDGDDSPGG